MINQNAYNQAGLEALRSLAFGSISGTYANLGSATTHPISMANIANTTDKDLIFSWNGGTTDHMRLGPNTVRPIPLAALQLLKQTGAQFAVKDAGSATTTGAAIVEIIYAI
jgi:hypothetical protein